MVRRRVAVVTATSFSWGLSARDQRHHSIAHVPLLDVEVHLEVRGIKRSEVRGIGVGERLRLLPLVRSRMTAGR